MKEKLIQMLIDNDPNIRLVFEAAGWTHDELGDMYPDQEDMDDLLLATSQMRRSYSAVEQIEEAIDRAASAIERALYEFEGSVKDDVRERRFW